MSKWAYNGIADYGLNSGFQQVANRVAIATAQPTTFGTWETTAAGTLSIASANWTLGTGDTNGRKLTLGAATIVVGTSGTVNHVTFAATTGSGTFIFAGTCAPTAVTAGGTVIVGAWDVDEINDPV